MVEVVVIVVEVVVIVVEVVVIVVVAVVCCSFLFPLIYLGRISLYTYLDDQTTDSTLRLKVFLVITFLMHCIAAIL